MKKTIKWLNEETQRPAEYGANIGTRARWKNIIEEFFFYNMGGVIILCIIIGLITIGVCQLLTFLN